MKKERQLLNQSLIVFRLVCITLLVLGNANATEQIKLNPSGVDAAALGEPNAFSGCPNALQIRECRVGTWSGQFWSSRVAEVPPSTKPLLLPYMKNAPNVSYRWNFSSRSVDEYLAETKATGLIILKDGQIVLERYQYDRKPDMPLRSFSMAKTVISMLVGIANQKGLISSLDDHASKYWPGISQSAYGQTTIRNLLRMASDIPFKELYTWAPGDDNWEWGRVLYATKNISKPDEIVAYLNSKTERQYEQGTKFNYASIETEILGRVLIRATGKSIAQLTQEWLWQPMGAEFKAYWLLSTTDSVEAGAGGFNAALRDYARLGNLLANDGRRDDQEVIPLNYLKEATDLNMQPNAFKPRSATNYYGYGYQTWLFPMKKRTFAFQGIHGQFIFVQPESKIVMVQTSVFDNPSGRFDPFPYKKINALWLGVLDSLGGDSSEFYISP
ncbi:serine hydrolase [Polynucleobacter sp. AP-Melu-500A-A1]|uniref:serine hydrolase domain-containing protein n=1 Tax=Polynucleobacter sp. AP-Melu-500A-A1 TaxID=2576929 RepID=UPI001C0AA30A|nr:serine hydrolase [Polynucleobacter sp. AP-Melu-500A-A1]MBU3631274.1 serine hydrolase [Polynucleobacter sp. AP-Melu-500A-A1]